MGYPSPDDRDLKPQIHRFGSKSSINREIGVDLIRSGDLESGIAWFLPLRATTQPATAEAPPTAGYHRRNNTAIMMSSGVYTSIDNQRVSGSVQATAGADHTAVRVCLQTFSPSGSHDKIADTFCPPPGADDTFSKQAAGSSNEPQRIGWMHSFTIAAYRSYFHVDTADVLERIKESLFPFKGSFTEKI